MLTHGADNDSHFRAASNSIGVPIEMESLLQKTTEQAVVAQELLH